MLGRLSSLVMHYDMYERHSVVRRLLDEALADDAGDQHILDVGGRAGLLGSFVPYHVASINVDGSGDLMGSGHALPFTGSAFAAVVSIDTLEHLPSDRRFPFVRECLRVAQRAVVVTAPYGSDGHRESEQRLAREYESTYGEPHVYLGEHIAYGLPDERDIEVWVRGLEGIRWRVAFAGDYGWQSRYFERTVLYHRGRGATARLWRLWHRVRSWALFHPVKLTTEPYPMANRLYLLLVKDL